MSQEKDSRMTPADAAADLADARRVFEATLQGVPGARVAKLEALLAAARAHERAVMEAKWLPPEDKPLTFSEDVW